MWLLSVTARWQHEVPLLADRLNKLSMAATRLSICIEGNFEDHLMPFCCTRRLSVSWFVAEGAQKVLSLLAEPGALLRDGHEPDSRKCLWLSIHAQHVVSDSRPDPDLLVFNSLAGKNDTCLRATRQLHGVRRLTFSWSMDRIPQQHRKRGQAGQRNILLHECAGLCHRAGQIFLDHSHRPTRMRRERLAAQY